MTNNELKNKLQTIANQSENSIEKYIAYDSLNFDENDCSTYIKNIITPNTSMGMAMSFQYSDIDDFYNTHKNDIQKKQKEFGITSEDLSKFKGDNTYNLCWIVIEETATKMAKELKII